MRALIVSVLAAMCLTRCQPVERDETGALVSEGNIDAFEIRVGDCFNDSEDLVGAISDSEEVYGVDGVPCTEPHDNEVYALFDVSGNTYPGMEMLEELAYSGCIDRFEPFVGRDYPSSALEVYPLFPTSQSWSRLNDREVVCALFNVDLSRLQGSMKGSGR